MMRTPRFAGRHYFADAGRLRASVESFIEDSNPARTAGELCALIAPHGPHRESGPIAGFAYKLLLTTPIGWDVTTVLAPSEHSAGSAPPAFLCDPSDAYDTPIDPMPIDRVLLETLKDADVPIALEPDDEAVIEDHLPFIQVALGDTPVLPLRLPSGFDGTTLARCADQLGLIIAAANLPASHEQASCDAIARLDERLFAVGEPVARPKAMSALLGRSAKQVMLTPSADAAVLALAIRLAQARGANRAQLLKREGRFAAFALLRA